MLERKTVGFGKLVFVIAIVIVFYSYQGTISCP